jgi:sulfate transport system ATP-binding protein
VLNGFKNTKSTIQHSSHPLIMQISVRGVSKNFGAFRALDEVSLDIPQGQLVALLGPSGSGKTTLLRIIAGLEAPDTGRVFYGDSDVTNRSTRDRGIGFVFQHYALFGHMTIFDNIAFGLRVRKWKNDQIRPRVLELLRLIQLEGVEKRFPSQLSGGQRQRVALARALAAQPEVMLLDEPFGALDAKVRADLRRWIRSLHDEIHMTSVFVTHDQEEAFEVADFVVVMNRGRVEQMGTPDDVFARPASAFVTDFLGRVNVFHGRVLNGKAQIGAMEVAVEGEGGASSEGETFTAYIRPHEVDIDRQSHGPDSMLAAVSRVNRTGSTVKVALFAQDGQLPLDVELPHEREAELGLRTGDMVWVYPRQVRVFAQNTVAEESA